MSPSVAHPIDISESEPTSPSATREGDEAVRAATAAVSSARTAVADDSKFGPMLVQALEDLARVKREAGQFDEALALYREAEDKAMAAAMDIARLSRLRTGLAALLDDLGRESEALPVYERAIKDLEAMQPPDMVMAGQLRNNLAMNYKRLNKFALAEQHYLAAIEALEGSLGRETEEVSSLFNNLGGLYYAAGFPDQAKSMFMDAMEIRLRLLGPGHPDMAQSHCNLGTVQYELGDNVAAQLSYEQSLRILEAHIKDEAASYEAVGMDYIAMLGAIDEDDKAAAFEKRLNNVLARHREEGQ